MDPEADCSTMRMHLMDRTRSTQNCSVSVSVAVAVGTAHATVRDLAVIDLAWPGLMVLVDVDPIVPRSSVSEASAIDG